MICEGLLPIGRFLHWSWQLAWAAIAGYHCWYRIIVEFGIASLWYHARWNIVAAWYHGIVLTDIMVSSSSSTPDLQSSISLPAFWDSTVLLDTRRVAPPLTPTHHCWHSAMQSMVIWLGWQSSAIQYNPAQSSAIQCNAVTIQWQCRALVDNPADFLCSGCYGTLKDPRPSLLTIQSCTAKSSLL